MCRKYIQKCTGKIHKMHPRYIQTVVPQMHPENASKDIVNALKIKVHPKYIQNAFKIHSKTVVAMCRKYIQKCTQDTSKQ